MRHYTTHGRILGVRCHLSHSGSTRLHLDGTHVQCAGCGALTYLTATRLHFPSRAAALAAEREIVGRPAWPDRAILASVAAIKELP